MKNFKTKIMTYNGNLLQYRPNLSYPNIKVFTCGNDRLTVSGVKGGQAYTVEINRNGFQSGQYITVKTRRGVYAVMTYYELLESDEYVEFIIDQYGSLQHYLDNVCCTTEYIKEKFY